jgi:hypothetical protein
MSERAASEVVSYVLVFGLVVSAVGIVSVSGLDTLQDVRNDEQLANAEKAFRVLSDNIADIHRRDAPGRATEINLGEAQIETAANVNLSVSVADTSGNTWQSEQWQIRPIVYRGDESRSLVYEAGAVYRLSEGGGVRVQDPPFVIRENRTLISVVGLNRIDRQSITGSTVLVRTRHQSTSLAYSSTEDDVRNVTVSLRDSPRTNLWRDYFNQTGFVCTDVTGGIDCTFEPNPTGSIDQVYVVYHDIMVDIAS